MEILAALKLQDLIGSNYVHPNKYKNNFLKKVFEFLKFKLIHYLKNCYAVARFAFNFLRKGCGLQKNQYCSVSIPNRNNKVLSTKINDFAKKIKRYFI